MRVRVSSLHTTQSAVAALSFHSERAAKIIQVQNFWAPGARVHPEQSAEKRKRRQSPPPLSPTTLGALLHTQCCL